ncbi:MAG: winged helix-turn-helix domain-containing protein [Alphaproteobacteria bacterium]
MIISIISQNSFIAELIQQYVHDDIEVCSYTSIALLQKEINLAQENIVIIDYESNISSENLEFVKNYSALVKIIILSNQTNNINSDKSSIIKKPFNIQTLYNLIDNIDLDLYKIYQITSQIYFNPSQRLIIKFNDKENAEEISLTEKESELLHYLILHKEQGIISKERLLLNVFGYKDASATHTLETHIYRMRNKISPNKDIFIQQDGGYQVHI